MGFRPNVQSREQRSQATPLAENILQMIQEQLAGGGFMGFDPLSRQAGTAMQQFVNSGGANSMPSVRDVGPAGADFGKMVSAMEQVQNRRVNEQAGNLREQAGAAGTRYGTTLAGAESDFRRESGTDFNVQLGQLGMALDEARRADTSLGINRDLAANQQMLTAIAQMFGMGQANTAPVFNMAGMGIMPENQIVSPGIGSQLLSGATNFAGGFAPFLAQFLLNRGQGPGQAGTPMLAGTGGTRPS